MGGREGGWVDGLVGWSVGRFVGQLVGRLGVASTLSKNVATSRLCGVHTERNVRQHQHCALHNNINTAWLRTNLHCTTTSTPRGCAPTCTAQQHQHRVAAHQPAPLCCQGVGKTAVSNATPPPVPPPPASLPRLPTRSPQAPGQPPIQNALRPCQSTHRHPDLPPTFC